MSGHTVDLFFFHTLIVHSYSEYFSILTWGCYGTSFHQFHRESLKYLFIFLVNSKQIGAFPFSFCWFSFSFLLVNASFDNPFLFQAVPIPLSRASAVKHIFILAAEKLGFQFATTKSKLGFSNKGASILNFIYQ